MTTTIDKKQKDTDSPIIKKVMSREAVTVKTEVVKTEIVVQEKSVHLKKENPETRYLKINPHYRPNETVGKPGKYIPELKLCGMWLEKAGFEMNSFVSVTIMDGLLVIRAAVEDEQERSS